MNRFTICIIAIFITISAHGAESERSSSTQLTYCSLLAHNAMQATQESVAEPGTQWLLIGTRYLDGLDLLKLTSSQISIAMVEAKADVDLLKQRVKSTSDPVAASLAIAMNSFRKCDELMASLKLPRR